LTNQEIIGPTNLAGDLDSDFSYTADVEYWEPPEDRGLKLDLNQQRMELLSVVVDIHFKNDRYGKIYRAACLKAVSTLPGPGQGPMGIDPIQQLFGVRE
ncbi:MAG: hypothetical protein JSU96_17840, partial [Acidobacteriota bacterium]